MWRSIRTFASRVAAALAVCLFSASWIGCEKADPQGPERASQRESKKPKSSETSRDELSDAGAEADREPRSPGERETWEVHYIQDRKVGYSTTATRALVAAEPDEPAFEFEQKTALILARFGEPTRQEYKLIWRENAAGELLDFEAELDMGAFQRFQGKKQGQLIEISVDIGERKQSWKVDSRELGGFTALETSLLRQPMKPGERRSLRSLQPPNFELGEFSLNAKEIEKTELLSGEAELLRVDVRLKFETAEMRTTVWTDENGEILKYEFPGPGMVAYRTTKEIAMTAADGAEFDIGQAGVVRLSKPIPGAHQARSIVYRVKSKKGDPGADFAQSFGQRVTPLGKRSAEIVTRRVDPETEINDEWPMGEGPNEADFASCPLVQSDDSRVIAMANEVAKREDDPWAIAQALERHVHKRMRSLNYSTAMASAADVAEDLEGDCTEHAMLLAGLARAREIPARVAVGLVYVDSPAMFAFHMWTEVFVHDRWLPLDATLGQGGIGGGHLKLLHSSLANGATISEFMPVLTVLGDLEIECLEFEE